MAGAALWSQLVFFHSAERVVSRGWATTPWKCCKLQGKVLHRAACSIYSLDIHYRAFCKLLNIDPKPPDKHLWNPFNFGYQITRRRNFFRNFDDVQNILSPTLVLETTMALLKPSGGVIPLAPLLGLCTSHMRWSGTLLTGMERIRLPWNWQLEPIIFPDVNGNLWTELAWGDVRCPRAASFEIKSKVVKKRLKTRSYSIVEVRPPRKNGTTLRPNLPCILQHFQAVVSQPRDTTRSALWKKHQLASKCCACHEKTYCTLRLWQNVDCPWPYYTLGAGVKRKFCKILNFHIQRILLMFNRVVGHGGEELSLWRQIASFHRLFHLVTWVLWFSVLLGGGLVLFVVCFTILSKFFPTIASFSSTV